MVYRKSLKKSYKAQLKKEFKNQNNMSIQLDGIDELPDGSAILVYDIEAIGDVSQPEQCHIWNLSAMKLGDKTVAFDQFVDPAVATIPEPPHPKLFKVTRQFLQNANASSPKEVLSYFCKWVQNIYDPENGGILLLVSHGNFRFDQPLLQSELLRHGIVVADNNYFVDALHWFRKIRKKRRSYSLSNLYKEQFNKPIKNAHLSLFDVHALHDLIQSQDQQLSGIAYHIYHTSLLRIPQIGLFSERLLYDKDMLTVEHLVYKFRNDCHCNPQHFCDYLLKGVHLDPSIVNNVVCFISNCFTF